VQKKRTKLEIFNLGTFEGSDAEKYEVIETATHTEHWMTSDGQWNRPKGPGIRRRETSCGQSLKKRDDGSFVTLKGVVLTPVES